MWDYYWGLSERQIELLLVDQAIVVYKHEKKKPEKKNGVREMKAPSAVKAAEKQLEWAKKYGEGNQEKIKINF